MQPSDELPFLKLLRTTLIPSDMDAQQIQEIVLRTEADLNQLEAEIGRARTVLDQLHCKHKKVLQSLEAHKSLLAPIRRLCPELLAEIFFYCLPQEQNIKPAALQAPLLLGQICATWRSIALSSPRLWSSLRISGRSAGPNMASLAKLWLSRAGTCPLSLSLRRSSLEAEKAFLDACEHALRWQIYLELSKQDQPFKILGDRTPLLETLEIHTPGGVDTTVRQFFTVLHSAPRLRAMTWHNSTTYSNPALPWGKLTSLTMGADLSANDCLDILEQSPSLEHAAFRIMFPSDILPPRNPVLVPNLSSLALNACEDLTFTLDHLILPVLCDIEFNMALRSIPEWPRSSFLSFLNRSGCSLEKLGLYFVYISETDLIECLQHLNTSLAELIVQSSGNVIVTDDILRLLTNVHLDTAQPVCLSPKLNTICLYGCLACSEGALADMTQSRLKSPTDDGPFPNGVVRLNVVEIYDDQVDMERLKVLRDKGLVLRIYRTGTSRLLENE